MTRTGSQAAYMRDYRRRRFYDNGLTATGAVRQTSPSQRSANRIDSMRKSFVRIVDYPEMPSDLRAAILQWLDRTAS